MFIKDNNLQFQKDNTFLNLSIYIVFKLKKILNNRYSLTKITLQFQFHKVYMYWVVSEK